MSVRLAHYVTTVVVRNPSPGKWHIQCPLSMRQKLNLAKDCQLEIAVRKVLPPPVKEE